MLDKLNNNSKLKNFLEGAKEEEGVDLMSLLIQPIQRLPRYELLLKELFKHTPQDCPFAFPPLPLFYLFNYYYYYLLLLIYRLICYLKETRLLLIYY